MIWTHKLRLVLPAVIAVALFFSGRTQPPEEREEPLVIIAGGDVMLGSWIEAVIGANGYRYPFARLDTVIGDGDIMFVNLEAPFGQGGTAFNKTYTFRVAPDLVQVLTAGRINVVSIANNHILDFGAQALRETMQILGQHQIAYAGAGMNLREARRPARMEVKGLKIAVACYSLTFPEEFWATDTSAGTCFPSHTFLYRDLKAFRQENDLVIVSFHWGAELMTTPKDYQVDLAHSAIRSGADLVLGHHPHVIQGLEIYQGKLIAYSLGNYVFGSYSESVKSSMLLKLQAGKSGVERFQVIPLNVYNREVEFQPRPLQGEEKEQFLIQLSELSQELNPRPLVLNSAEWVEL